MSQDRSFAELMARLRAGDEEAAALVFNRFTQRLIALARGRLGQRLRQKVDPEDVLQSVYKSFFLRQAQGQFDPGNWDGLWGLLTVMTLRKCGRWVERFHTGRRNIALEVSAPPSAEGSGDDWDHLAHGPTPLEAVRLAETVELLLQGLDERDRAIVVLGLQGYTPSEIHDQVGCTTRTVQRVLKRVKERLQRQQAEERESP